MSRHAVNKKIAIVLVFAMVAGLLQAAGIGAGRAFAAGGTDALDGLSWIAKPSGSTDSTDSFRTAAYGNGTIVATGTPPMPFYNSNQGDMHQGSLYRNSTTGVEWTTLSTGVNHEIRSLASGGPVSFVGVGYSQYIMYGQQSYYGKIMTSNDGVNWTSRSLPGESGTTLYGVTYGSPGYVAVGASNDINFNQTQAILTSSNGTTWVSQTAAGSGALNAVAFGGGTYVAVGSGGTILSSPNGVNWTAQNSGVTTTLRGITYGNGLFVAVGSSGKILTSPNGADWTVSTPPVSGTFYGAAFGDGTFLVVGGNGTILSSSDGQNWQQRTSGTTAVLYGAAYVNGEFMALGSNGTILMAQHKRNYTAGPNGSISGNTAQGVRTGGSATTVTAVGNTGYRFVNWSDGNTNPIRTDSNITGDLDVTANFEIIVYNLNYAAGEHGSLTGDAAQNVPHGGNATTVTAVADPSYHFVSWSDGNASASRTDNNVTGNLNVTAQFAIDTYKLTYTAGAGGSIWGQASQVQTVEAGSDGQSVTATPNTGYHFTGWSDGLEDATRVDRDIRVDKSFTASFAINEYTLTYTAAAGGSLSGETSQTVTHGSNGSEVTANPNPGYSFVGWSDGITTASRTDIAVLGSKNVTALFAINKYALTYTAGAGGSIDQNAIQTVDFGTDGQTVTAVAHTGYHFARWSDGVPTASRQEKNVQANLSVTAEFEINQYDLTYTAGAHGTLTGVVHQTPNYGADGTEVTAVADTGYHFVRWSDGVATASRTDLNVTGNLSVAAEFAINTFTLTYTAGAGGSVSGAATQEVDYGADGTEVKAEPAIGYHFTGWSDGVQEAVRTDKGNVADLNVTANFAINEYTLTYAEGQHGTLTGDKLQTVQHGADGTEVTAVADTGYHFTRWSDGVTTASRTDVNVTGNLNVTAEFAINTITLTYTAGAGGSVTGTATQEVDYGADGTEVKAEPATGYHFTGWSDGAQEAVRTDKGNVADLNVTANFAINEYTLTYAEGQHGTLTGDKLQTVQHGADGTEVTAVADTGYHFTRWSDGVTTASRTDVNVTGNLNVTAEFAINTITLTYTAGAGGSVTGTATQEVDYGADGTEVKAEPATGYHFTGWSDGAQEAVRTDKGNLADLNVTANFAINEYTLTYAEGQHGTLTGDKLQTVQHGSDGTEVTAAADAGYHFTRWSDGVATASRTDLNVTGNLSVTAEFAINTFKLTYSASTGGSVTGTATQEVDYGADGTEVTAVPDAGYRFVSWSDGLGTATRTDRGVTGNLNVTAAFAAIGNSGSGSNTGSSSGFDILIDGKTYRLGELKSSNRGGQTVSTISMSVDKVKEVLASAGQQVTVVLPIKTGSDVAIAELPGELLQLLIEKQASLRIETEYAAYTLPMGLIDLAKLFGGSVNAKDVVVSVELSKPTAEMTALAQKAVEQNQLTLALPPVNFSISVSYEGKKTELSTFASYVERMIAIPESISGNEALTAIVVEPDGSVRPVPTKLFTIDGKRFAVINSLTNSLYALVSKTAAFSDVSHHWAKNAVEDMALRLIVGGAGDGLFHPNKAITRAEFSAIIVRALGLRLENGASSFSDVKASAWYADAVQTAYSHKLISGYPDGKFHPNDSITREQAMTIIAKAMALTGIQTDLPESSVNELIKAFSDKGEISAWAKNGIAACLQAGVVSGQSAAILAPAANITRAEATVIIQRLLLKSNLI